MSREVYVPYDYTSFYVQRFGLENETPEHHEEMIRRVERINELIEQFIIHCVRNKIKIDNYILGTFEKLLYEGYTYNEAFNKAIFGYSTIKYSRNLLSRIEKLYFNGRLTFDEIREFYEMQRDTCLAQSGREGIWYTAYLESECSQEPYDYDEYSPEENQEEVL